MWGVTNDAERLILRPMLLSKNKQLENRVSAERAPLEQKLKAALSETSAPGPAIPRMLKKLLTSGSATATH